jgi:hypothetical protein
MPITWAVNGTRRLVHVTISDPYTFQEWETVANEVLQHPDFVPGLRLLVDRRQASAPTTAFVRGIIDFGLKHTEQLGSVRTAVVVADQSVAYGMARMAELLVEAKGLPFATFTCNSIEEAERWLERVP